MDMHLTEKEMGDIIAKAKESDKNEINKLNGLIKLREANIFESNQSIIAFMPKWHLTEDWHYQYVSERLPQESLQ